VPAAATPPSLVDVEAQQDRNHIASSTSATEEEAKQHNIVHSVPSFSDIPPSQHRHGDNLREEHCRLMERLHAALIHLSMTNARMVDWMHADFLQEISNSNTHDILNHGSKAATTLHENYDNGELDFSSKDSIVSSARSAAEDMELYQIYLQDVNGGEHSSSASARESRNFNRESIDRQKLILLEAAIHKLFGIQICFNAFFYSCHHLARVVMDMSDTVFTLTELAQKKSHQPF
jgi:hypothetical protein